LPFKYEAQRRSLPQQRFTQSSTEQERAANS